MAEARGAREPGAEGRAQASAVHYSQIEKFSSAKDSQSTSAQQAVTERRSKGNGATWECSVGRFRQSDALHASKEMAFILFTQSLSIKLLQGLRATNQLNVQPPHTHAHCTLREPPTPPLTLASGRGQLRRLPCRITCLQRDGSTDGGAAAEI